MNLGRVHKVAKTADTLYSVNLNISDDSRGVIVDLVSSDIA